MNSIPSEQISVNNADFLIREINELIHVNLNKEWMAKEWEKLEGGEMMKMSILW